MYIKIYLMNELFFKQTNNDTLLKVQESLHEFVYSKAKHILGSEKIEEIRSIVNEAEAQRIANLFPSVPTKTPTLKKGRGKRKKTKKKKTKKKKTRKGEKQKRRK